MSLTPRQREILEFIRRFLAERGYAPSLMEIGQAFSLTSSATVHKHLTALEARGALRRSKGKRRYLEVEDALPPARSPVELPLVGTLAAGRPIGAVTAGDRVGVPAFLAPKAPAYVLRVSGDSLLDEQMRDGDFVVVEQNASPENGATVVALLRGSEAALKRFYREKGRIRLQPADPKLAPLTLPARAVNIQGVVRGLLRKY